MIWFALYVASIFTANWAITSFGVVPVGAGLVAPAGVYFAGLAFTLRDLLQESKGWRWSAAAIVVGAALSALISPQFALASGVAFGLSEGLDLMVYTPLRSRGWLKAVFVSNAFGLAADSVSFLIIAFGSLDFVLGQIVGKLWVTLVTVAILAVLRSTVGTLRHEVLPRNA